MANTDLTLAATFKAKPGKEDLLRQVLERLVEPTLNEEGNLGYALHQGVQDPTLFYFYEAYKDQAAIDHHMNTPYLAKALVIFPGGFGTLVGGAA